MRIYYLAGVILSVTTILSACGEGTPVQCTISTARETRQGIIKTGMFASGTDCEQMRLLAESGQPLPTLAGSAPISTAPKVAETPAAPTFNTPFVAGQKTQDLIAITDKQARVQELEQKIGVDSKQSRDPFTSTVINPVPKLETLLAKKVQVQPNLRAAVVVRTSNRPSKVVLPPDTRAADGTKVTGTVEVAGTIYAIISAFGESTSRYVSAGQMISNGRVLVKRIDTNAEPPIVVLQQNGVEVLRAVGAPIISSNPDQPVDPAVAPVAPVPANPQPTTAPFTLLPPAR
jgi:hypothetical protein